MVSSIVTVLAVLLSLDFATCALSPLSPMRSLLVRPGPPEVLRTFSSTQQRTNDDQQHYKNTVRTLQAAFEYFTNMEPEKCFESPAVITEEMEYFFEVRTKMHVLQVVNNIRLLDGFLGYPLAQLEAVGAIHDTSKFVEPERTWYIWLSWNFLCDQLKMKFVYPFGIGEQVNGAIQHHLSHNPHHPESHASPDDMVDLEIIEMISDWTSVSLEWGETSCRKWADENIDRKWNFSANRKEFIYKVIDELDRRLQENPDSIIFKRNQ